jgi:hypothetical protein
MMLRRFLWGTLCLTPAGMAARATGAAEGEQRSQRWAIEYRLTPLVGANGNTIAWVNRIVLAQLRAVVG